MRKWAPLVAVLLGTFMLLVDVTIVNVALPQMARDLDTSFANLQWVIDAYALTLAALLLGIGTTADIVGHRTVYLAGLGLFAVASFTCGIAPNVEVLIASRAVQGIGGAAMFATTFALLNSSYQGRDRGTAYGMWGAVAGASAATGPIIGGLLTEGISWRWIFFVNLPVSVLAIWLSLRVLPADRPRTGARLDLPGVLTFTGSAGVVTYALIRAGNDGWGSFAVLGLLALGAVLLAAFVAVEWFGSDPMLDLGLFRRRSFVGLMVGALLLNFAAFAGLTYTSIWLQSLLGLSPIEAGLTTLPLSGGAFLVSASIGRFLHGGSPHLFIGGGLLLIGAGAFLVAAMLGPSSSWPALVLGFLVIGLGVGLGTPTLASSAMGAVPPERGGMAAGAVNTARQLGYAFGIAVLGTVFASRAADSLRGSSLIMGGMAEPDARLLAGGQAGRILAKSPGLDHAFHTAFADGLDAVFVVSGIAGVVAGIAVLFLVRPQRAKETPAAQADLAGSVA
jgi:EmrB/QacA subfamily drug resistance transporter